MAIEDDISVAVNGNIRYTGLDSGGTGGRYTVLELHRFLQDLADDAEAAGDDLLDITSDTPSERATDNIITLNSPYNIDDDLAQYLYDGSITQDGGDTRYSGLVVVGSLAGVTTLQVVQDNLLYDGDAPFWSTGINDDAAANILSRMLIKTRASGADIDGNRIRVFAREWGHTFAEFSVTMGLGNSTAAIFTNTDLNNDTAVGTVAGWTSISNIEGYQLIDLNNGNGDRPYYSQWDKSSYTLKQLYERCKYITRRGTSEVIHGIDGELFRGITHQWNYDNPSSGADWTENDVLYWGSGATAGTGLLIAINEQGATGTMWIQLLTGVAPTDGMTIYSQDSAPETCTVDGTVTARTISPVFLGTYTGSSIIGAFGIGIDPTDLGSSDLLFDLTNTQQQPPNNVTFYVYGLDAGESRLLVTNSDAGGIDFAQMRLGTTLNGASETTVVIDYPSGGIPADTPQTCIIRIETDSGLYKYCEVTSHDGNFTFTINSEDFSSDNASAGNNIFIAYLDKLAASATESFTVVYSQARTLFVRARDGGLTPEKTFETTAALGTGGGSATVNFISDT